MTETRAASRTLSPGRRQAFLIDFTWFMVRTIIAQGPTRCKIGVWASIGVHHMHEDPAPFVLGRVDCSSQEVAFLPGEAVYTQKLNTQCGSCPLPEGVHRKPILLAFFRSAGPQGSRCGGGAGAQSRLIALELGDASLDAFVVERLETLLELRDYTEALELGGAKTMDELTERFQRGLDGLTAGRTDLGREVEAALGEVLAHVRGEASLPCRTVGEPAVERTSAVDRHQDSKVPHDEQEEPAASLRALRP